MAVAKKEVCQTRRKFVRSETGATLLTREPSRVHGCGAAGSSAAARCHRGHRWVRLLVGTRKCVFKQVVTETEYQEERQDCLDGKGRDGGVRKRGEGSAWCARKDAPQRHAMPPPKPVHQVAHRLTNRRTVRGCAARAGFFQFLLMAT